MDLFVWIFLGLAGGLAVSALAPDARPRAPSTTTRPRVRTVISGAAGALVAGLAAQLNAPGLPADRLSAGICALTGALALAGIAEAYASRRRRGEATILATRATEEVPITRLASRYDAARDALVEGLLADAVAHDAGRYTDVGRELTTVRAALARMEPGGTMRLQLALRFWSHWSNACRGTPEATASGEWPRLARALAAHLSLDDEARNAFTFVDPEQGSRKLRIDKARSRLHELFLSSAAPGESEGRTSSREQGGE